MEQQDPTQAVDVSIKIYYNHKLHDGNFHLEETRNVTYKCIDGWKLLVQGEVSSAKYPVHLQWRIAPTGEWHEKESEGFPISVDLAEETTPNCQDIYIRTWVQHDFGRGPWLNTSTGKSHLQNIGLLIYEWNSKSFEVFYPWNPLKRITIEKSLYANDARMLMLSNGNIFMFAFDESNAKIIEIINVKDGTFTRLSENLPHVLDEVHTECAITRIGHDVLLCGGDGSKSCVRYQNKEWIHDSNMMSVRRYHTLTSCAGFTFAIAGYDGDGYLSSTEIYNARTGSWQYWHPLPTGSAEHRSACLDNVLYVCGGYHGEKHRTCHKHVLTPSMELNNWESMAPMNEKRSYFALVAAGGKLIALGGYDDNGPIESVEMYDPKTDTWTLLSRELKAGGETSAVVVLDGGDIHL